MKNSMLQFKSMKKSLLLGAILALALGCGDQSGEFEYVALGASDATGVGASPLSNGYVFRIQRGLKDDGKDVGLINLGIPGAEIRGIKNLEVPVAIEEKPELITIFTGANDMIAGASLQDFSDDLGTTLRELSTHTDAVIAIATLPDLTRLPKFQESPDRDVTEERVSSFNSAIRVQARRYGATLVEISNLAFSDGDVSDDGFHPNDEGHRVLADAFLEKIRPVLR